MVPLGFMVHPDSAIPLSSKLQYVLNEKRRISDRCSSSQDAKRHCREFDSRLTQLGYSRDFIEVSNQRGRQIQNKAVATNKSKRIFMQMPFISDSFDRKIKGIFRKHDTQVILAHRGNSLRSALKPETVQKTEVCKMSWCSLKSQICQVQMAVYEMKCVGCGGCYIGSIISQIHIRIREPLS